MPESKSVWKAFGAHNGERGLGAISVELCCLFDLVSRAPLRFVYGKALTSEHKLIRKLIESLRKNDLLLLPGFQALVARHFLALPYSYDVSPGTPRAHDHLVPDSLRNAPSQSIEERTDE